MMLFHVKRTSRYEGETSPCKDAFCVRPYDYDMCEPAIWGIELTDLSALMQFVRQNGKCVVRYEDDQGVMPTIEIYDGWRE